MAIKEIHGINNRKKLIGLLICFGIVSVILYFASAVVEGGFFRNATFCDSYDAIIEGKTMADLSVSEALLFHEQGAPFIGASNTALLSQDTDKSYWEGELQVGEGYELYLLNDEYWSNKIAAISSGHPFSALIVKGDEYRPVDIMFSGVPVLCLTETYGWENPSLISLMDVEKEKSYDGYCSFGMRGQTSATLPKYGYKIALCNETWNKESAPLLGLRNDDDWIINPLYGDYNKIREKMAYQIWEEMQQENQGTATSSQIVYVELILNSQYWGIYGLQEKVDAKQVSFNDTDIMYRKTDLLVPTQEDFAVEDGTSIIPGFEIREPSEEDIKAEDWLPLKEYVNYIYYEDTEVDMDILNRLMDVDNAIDYELYLQLLTAPDNIFKNINYYARYENGSYMMYQAPWDVNYTFGHDFGANATYTEYHASHETTQQRSREYSALLRADEDATWQMVSEKWFAYRETIFAEDHLKEMAQSYMDELVSSGAMGRDTIRWPESMNSSDLTEMYHFLEMRLAYLDEYYAGDLGDETTWNIE